jgi:hypothetical protein
MPSDVSLDFVLRAPPGGFLVERFSKIEMLNIECSFGLNSSPENVLAEIDSYTRSTFRNLLIEGHIRVELNQRHAYQILNTYRSPLSVERLDRREDVR